MRDLYFAIARANAEYARCIDDDRLEEWPEFFAESCVYRVTSAANFAEGLQGSLIFADSRGMLRDRVSALRQANIYERQAYRHILGAPCILGVEGERIRAEAPFMAARIMRDGTTMLFATGRYMDVWRQIDDKLELIERIVICDSSRIDTLLALPL